MSSSTTKTEFVDYFGKVDYSNFRPVYPASFIEEIIQKSLVPPKSIIDIGCGSGQATFLLASHCPLVIGVDPSMGQIKAANESLKTFNGSRGELKFVQGGAEDLSIAGIAYGELDMITAAQCAHWFDLDRFYEESRKYLSPQGTLALWCYTRPLIVNCPEVEEAFDQFYSKTIGKFWPPSRKIIEEKYQSIQPLGFSSVERFDSQMEYKLNNSGLIGYINTWSAMEVAKQSDPSREWDKELKESLMKQGEDMIYDIVTPIHVVLARK